MKYTKHLLTALTLASPLMINSSILFAAPYICIQAGTAHGHPINVWFENKKNTVPTGRIAVGADWRLSENFKLGLESGAQGYKKLSKSSPQGKTSSNKWSVDALTVADFILNKHFDVAAKAGLAYVIPKNEVTIEQEEMDFRHRIKSTAYVVPKAALGLGFNILDNMNLNVSVSHEFKKNSSRPGSTSILAGIKYKFS